MSQYTQARALLESLKEIPDYRVDTGKIEYALHEVLFMVIFALLKGYTTYKDITGWMTYNVNNPVLLEIFETEEIKAPSKSTLHDMMTNTNNNTLEKVFRSHFAPFVKKEEIAIDGKWLKGSDANGQYVKASHKAILNILDKKSKIVFAHKLLDKNKQNEITALKEALAEDDLFSDEGQIFSFDAIQTQPEILNRIDADNNKYIAKVKGNQKELWEKIVQTIETFEKPIDTYIHEEVELSHGKHYVKRELAVYAAPSADWVMFHKRFNNIQSLIKLTKTLYNPKTKESGTYTEYFMTNFKTTAEDFNTKILAHWRVETYHYHLDMLMDEDDHIAYKEPFAMAILRSFAVNLLQLFHNDNKDKKVLPTGKTTMAEIKRTAHHNDWFTAELFEQKAS